MCRELAPPYPYYHGTCQPVTFHSAIHPRRATLVGARLTRSVRCVHLGDYISFSPSMTSSSCFALGRVLYSVSAWAQATLPLASMMKIDGMAMVWCF